MAVLGDFCLMAESSVLPRSRHSLVPSPLKYVSQNVSIAFITESASPSVEVLMTCRSSERSRSSSNSEPDCCTVFLVIVESAAKREEAVGLEATASARLVAARSILSRFVKSAHRSARAECGTEHAAS